MKLPAFISKRPWIWVVLLFVFFVTANLIMAAIAISVAPEKLTG